MVMIPPGEFMLGSPPREPNRSPNEGPQQRVRIAQAFAMAKFETTFAEWDSCVAAGACRHRPDDDWGRGREPVSRVSWHDAKEYAAWLSAKTSKSYRLPSEAEWEYAARAGTTTAFSTGATIRPDQANFDGDYGYAGSTKGRDRRRAVEVGSFSPNAFGLHDMHGNVWEWVEDCYHGGYAGSPFGGRPAPETAGCKRVLRGGSWYDMPVVLRSAFRLREDPTDRTATRGFRLVRVLER
jgi:formylglycine-generating enzyme required for sulfatase activity